MRELELKILLDDAGAARLRAAVKASGMAEGAVRRQNLRGVYFDTPNGALAQRKLALRLRKEGRRWVQTVKANGSVQGGLSSVREAECAAPGGRLALDAIPQEDLREAVVDALNGTPPAPVYETAIRRESWLLRPQAGGAVELALDAGDIHGGGAEQPIIEAELELKEGDARALYAAAEALFPKGVIRFSRRSKAARARALAAGEPAISAIPQPVFAADAPLERGMTTEEAAQASLRNCLDQISGNVAAAALGDSPKGPHQLRVGLRRLRTAASLYRPAIGGPGLDALAAEAQAFAAEVGRARDLDVLSDEMIAPFEGDDPGFAALRAAVEARRKTARKAMVARLGEPRSNAFLFALGAFVEARGWLDRGEIGQTLALARPVEESAVAALNDVWRKADKLGRRIDRLEGEARHDLRKRLKKLRYALEFFAPLWPEKKVKGFLRPLKILQDDFGALQDAATAREILTAPQAPALADPAAQRAVGLLLGRKEAEAERLWLRVQGDWSALAARPLFWR